MAPLPADLMGKSAADRERQAGADDAVGAEHADRHVGDVHRAAATFADAFGAAHDLQEEAIERNALGNGVAVAAVVRGESVVAPQRRHDARRDRLLADRKMNEARDLAVGEQLREPRLGLADHAHRAVQREQRGQIRRQVRAHLARSIPVEIVIGAHSGPAGRTPSTQK